MRGRSAGDEEFKPNGFNLGNCASHWEFLVVKNLHSSSFSGTIHACTHDASQPIATGFSAGEVEV